MKKLIFAVAFLVMLAIIASPLNGGQRVVASDTSINNTIVEAKSTNPDAGPQGHLPAPPEFRGGVNIYDQGNYDGGTDYRHTQQPALEQGVVVGSHPSKTLEEIQNDPPAIEQDLGDSENESPINAPH